MEAASWVVYEVTCTGQGDVGGGHCCWINGEVCQFLFTNREGIPRCSIWDDMPTPEWKQAPVGQMFAKRWPWKTCRDWPQKIPEVMAKGVGLCCWRTS